MHPVPRSILVSGALLLAAPMAAADIASTRLGDHPYGDYTETVADGSGHFYSIWAGRVQAGFG